MKGESNFPLNPKILIPSYSLTTGLVDSPSPSQRDKALLLSHLVYFFDPVHSEDIWGAVNERDWDGGC